MSNAIQTYPDRRRAEKACALRSLNAYRAGRYSQYELRQLGPNGYVGGPYHELATRFPQAKVVAQWSGGYRV